MSLRNLMALTLADVWNLATDGQAIIIAQGSVFYAAAGLGGHGFDGFYPHLGVKQECYTTGHYIRAVYFLRQGAHSFG